MTTDSSSPGDAFTPPADPAAFDLEGWLSEASLPTRSVVVVGRAGLVSEYERLEAELRDLRAADASDGRLGRAGDGRSLALAQRLVALEATMRASRLTLILRALTTAERKGITDAATKNSDGTVEDDDYNVRFLAASCVSPVMTVDQARRLKDRVGEGQFQDVLRAVVNLMQSRVTVPTSPAASALLSQRESLTT